MKRNKIYDCTQDSADREVFLSELLMYKKLALQTATPAEALAAEDALAIVFDPTHSEETLEKFPNRSKDIESIRVIDAAMFENGRMWPRSLYRRAFQDIVFDKAPALNTQLRCYVAGDHPLIPVALESFSRLGYAEFFWVAGDPEKVRPAFERARRVLLGVEVQFIKTSDLTLQANNGSLILNGVTSAEDQPILDDLAYLNFLQPPGLIIDLQASEPVDWGVDEQEGRGFPIVTRKDLQKVYDSVLMKALTEVLNVAR